MQEELLVSVISPCYNGEKYLKHFLESLLEQTYSNVEFIIVNDGSNDNSEKIILSYKDKIEKKGWTFKYIFQENKGQAAAINRGLSIFKGKYLMWVDSDDILKKDNIKHKVDFLNKNPGCGMVICETEVVNENNLNKRIKILKRHNKKQKNDNLFLDLIIGYNVYYHPGGYMITREAFENSIPKKQIYESRIGQNWQMLLPIVYNYKCGYLSEILFTYVIRKQSHSRQKRGEQELLKQNKEQENTLKIVINDINMKDESEKERYLKLVEDTFFSRRMYIYYKYNDKEKIKANYNRKKKNHEKINIKEKIYYYSTKNKLMKLLCKIYYILIKCLEKLCEKIKIYV